MSAESTTAALSRLRSTLAARTDTEEREIEFKWSGMQHAVRAAAPRNLATDFRKAVNTAIAAMRKQSAAVATINHAIAELALRHVCEKYGRVSTEGWRDSLAIAVGKFSADSVIAATCEILTEPVDPNVRNAAAVVAKRAGARAGR